MAEEIKTGIEFEDIQPWGTTGGDTGLSSRLKLKRNFEKIKAWVDNVSALLSDLGDDKYLSKTHDDEAQGVITFLQGLIFDTVLKSKGAIGGFTSGKGIWMDAAQGLIETDGLEVRGFMRIMELVINRLQLMESDYSFTEGGEIEHVDYTDDGRLKLRMHKRYDGDLTPFYEGDILYAKINDLLPPGTVPDGHIATAHGSYFTSWVMVDEVDLAENTLTVSLYQSREAGGDPIVPGGTNFTLRGTPIEGTDHPSVALASEAASEVDGAKLGETGFDCSINVTRHGNTAASADETVRAMQRQRQQSWVLSTTDQRLAYYWRVDQPIIRDDNYALILGMLPDLKNLPSTRDPEMPSLYINTIFYENEHHIYYPSRIVKEDRGEWTANPTATYTGPSGTYTPDGTLSDEDQAMVGGGGTFTSGTTISEPYHYEGVTRATWLTCRLSPAWASLTDEKLMGKIRKEWHLDLETSRAWRDGMLWECRKEGATDEPWVTSAQWLLLSTGALTLRIATSRRILRRQYFDGSQVGTTLGFVLTAGSADASDRIAAQSVTWERITTGAESDAALAAADAAWNQNSGRHRLTVDVRAADLPSNFWTVREVTFRVTVDIEGLPEPETASLTMH